MKNSTLDVVITYAHDVWCEVGVSILGLMCYHITYLPMLVLLEKATFILYILYSIISLILLKSFYVVYYCVTFLLVYTCYYISAILLCIMHDVMKMAESLLEVKYKRYCLET